MSLPKSILVLVLAVSMLLSAFLVPIMYLDYNLRKDYISEVLCVNRAKPMTVCGGQCYLAKQLDKAQEQQDKEQSLNLKLDLNFFQEQTSEIQFNIARNVTSSEYKRYQVSHWADAYIGSVFQPPQSV